MNSLTIGLISTGCIFGGMLLGWWLQTRLPGQHLSKETQDTVKLGAGMVATMAALVLGLLVSSAKNAFDSANASIAQSGARIIMLDHVLGDYGPETKEVRADLRKTLSDRIEKIWSVQKGGPSGMSAIESSKAMEVFQSALRTLSPKDDAQKSLLAEARQINNEVWQSRLLLIEQQQEALPATLLVVLVVWLTMLFISFGLFAPRNVTVFTVMLICAVSVSSAIFLILEMSRPLDGFIKVTDAPLRKALEMLGR